MHAVGELQGPGLDRIFGVSPSPLSSGLDRPTPGPTVHGEPEDLLSHGIRDLGGGLASPENGYSPATRA